MKTKQKIKVKYCISCKKLKSIDNYKKLWCGLFSSQCLECDEKEKAGYNPIVN
jgi:hypothetical protein